MEKISPRISCARINLREFVVQYFLGLILQLEGTSLETFGEFFERNVGSEGSVV